LHGDMDQVNRTKTLAAYKNGATKFLICSDVAGRGLDIDGVSHVFNFDVPTSAESYVHRVGRTGRAGRTGIAITLVTPQDEKYVRAITQLIGMKIPVLGPEEINLDNNTYHVKNFSYGMESSSSESTNKNRKDSDKPPNSNDPSTNSRSDKQIKNYFPDGDTKADEQDRIFGLGDHMPDFLKHPTTYKG